MKAFEHMTADEQYWHMVHEHDSDTQDQDLTSEESMVAAHAFDHDDAIPADFGHEHDGLEPDAEGTSKQVLVEHCKRHHRRRVATDRRPWAELTSAHATDHWRSGFLDHYHAGENRGPGERPPGWRTGRDCVVTRRSR